MEKEIKVTPLYFDYVFGAQYDAVVEVGGRYSGKSYNSQIEEACNLMSKEDYKLLIIQELDKGSSDGYYAGLVDKIEQFEHESAYNITTSSTKITNELNGNSVLFRGYKTEQQKKDVKNIDQVTKIIVEEGEWMTFDDFLALIQQLRGKIHEDRRLDILLNPVNEYCFANVDLIEPVPDPDKVLEYFPNSRRPKVFEKIITTDYEEDGETKEISIKILVVLSTHYDNPHLTGLQRASIEIYRTTDPDKYLQLGEARFIRPGGVHFKEFKEEIHVCKARKIPSHWDRYSTIDYGLDMLAGLWIAVDEYGKAYVYKDTNEPDLIISAAANKLHTVNNGESLAIRYAPPDLWNRRQETGKSVYEWFAESRWYLVKSDNNRSMGAMAMKEWLRPYPSKDIETGLPTMTADLQIFDTCHLLIKHLKMVLTDEKDPNKYANEPHAITHNLDALRGFCIMRTSPSAAALLLEKPSQNNFIEKPKEVYQVEYSNDYINMF